MLNQKDQQGFSTIELLVVVTAIVVLAGLAVPNLVPARQAAHEGSAIANVRQLMSAQAHYSATRGGSYGTLEELKEAELIDESLASGELNGYQFEMQPDGDQGYSVTAIPVADGETVQRRFYGDETGVIRYTNDGSPPTAQSPGLGGTSGAMALIPVES